MAADHQLITSVAAIYEYNDNIRLSPDDELSDSIYTVAPRLELASEGERLSVRADGMAEFYRYQDYDEFDDTDQWYNGSLDYRPTERWQLAVEGHVSDDNRPDRDIEDTGVVLKSIRRKRINAGATSTYMFSELTSGGLFVEFNRENFDDDETSDRKDYHAVLFVTRNLDGWLARTTGRLNLGYSRYEFEREFGLSTSPYSIRDENRVDYYSITAGTDTAFTERLTVKVDLGGRYSESENEQQLIPIGLDSVTENNDNYGFVGSLTATYRGERSSCSLFLSHDLQPVSGENGTANRTTVRLSGSMRLLEKLRGNLAFQWYQNLNDQDDPTQDDIDTQTWNARAGLTWELSKYIALKGEYAYTVYEDNDAGTTAYRNKFLVQLTAQHDWLE
jgi:hypothetical protein